jgi:acetolactate synthase-1/2/3 large subunit
MAAALSEPEGRAILLSGDGAFGYHAMDFEALVRHKLRVVTIIGNDAGFAQTRNSQVALYGRERVVATDLEHARYDKVVTALGGQGFWVESEADLGEALDQAFESEGPACVNVKL